MNQSTKKRADENTRGRKSADGRNVWLPAPADQYEAIKRAAKSRYMTIGGFLMTLAKQFLDEQEKAA